MRLLRSNGPRVAVVGTAVLLTAACGPARVAAQGPPSSAAASEAAPVPTVGATVTVDPGVGEIFVPVSGVVPRLDAATVWQRFARLAGSSNVKVPPGTTVELGKLTLPLGPGRPDEFRANAQEVWSFSWRQCAPRTFTASPTDLCTAVAFFDASTGELVDQTWHQ